MIDYLLNLFPVQILTNSIIIMITFSTLIIIIINLSHFIFILIISVNILQPLEIQIQATK